MKVVMFMAITPNGLIAKENDDTSFVSRKDLMNFKIASKKAGNLIIGRKTYEIMLNEGFPLPDRLNVVITKRRIRNKWGNNVVFVKSPKQALKILKENGFKTAFVAGGGKINSSFMKKKLVDEIYLDIEPRIFGKGIKLFSDAKFEHKLNLIGVRKFSKNEIQLHYKVIK